MGISNFTLNRIFNDIKDYLLESKIEKIVNISANGFIFMIYKNGKSKNCFLSLDPSLPIVLLDNSAKIDTINVSSYQCNILKKYFEHGTINNIYKVENDRIIIFEITKWSPSYQLLSTKLIFELFPLSPNIIIVDENFIIIDAFKFSDSLDNKHPIAKNITYQFPQVENKHFDDTTPIEKMKGKVSNSEYKYLQSLSKSEYVSAIQKMIDEKGYYLYKNDVSSLKFNDDSIHVTINDLYGEITKRKIYENKQNRFQFLFKLVEQKIKSNEKKLINLSQDQSKFINYNHYQEYGNLLFLGEDLYHKGDTKIDIDGIIISLDPKLNLKENAQRYFKLYKKSKTGLLQIEHQKEIALAELDYFKNISNQLKFASNNDIQEILLDLSENHYLKGDKIKQRANKKPANKKYLPHFININGKAKIGYGLSAFQNEELTFNIAQKNDLYLHIKDYHGPHVILFSEHPTDEDLLFACEVAIYFASQSCGEVYCTKRKNVKKVPGKRGLVTMNDYTTINIKQIRENTISLLKSL